MCRHAVRYSPRWLFALAAGLLFATLACAAPLRPTQHGDFAHYTFALTWQPGFCGTGTDCLPDQPRDHLIGLHGLWASRPKSLIRQGISAPQWWRLGCDYFHHSNRAPQLTRATDDELRALMPHLKSSLLTHEYDKHVQCFGFDTQAFFDTELRMRRQIADSAFGRYLIGTAQGHTVQHATVIAAFMDAFDTDQKNSLQLRCENDRHGHATLTQLWISLHADALGRFPRDGSLMNAPINQDNCPASFFVPGWPKDQVKR